MKYNSIALFCGSSAGENPIYAEQAALFGSMVAQQKLTLYYGGGSIGLMGCAADAAMSHGGTVIGIAPDFFSKGNVLSDRISELIFVKTMSERKQMMEEKADAFVIFPGGYGTMDELFEVLTDAQLGFHNKPVLVYNFNHFFDPLLAQMDHFCNEGFVRPFHKGLLLSATTLEGIFEALNGYENTNDRNWLSKIKQ